MRARLLVLGVLAIAAAGCSGSDATATSSVTPSPSVAPPSVVTAPTPTPAGSPTPEVASERVAAFFDLIRDPDVSYRLDETYELTLGAEHQSTISRAEVGGGDSLYVSDSVAGETKRHEETATVDGTVYRRIDGGPWAEVGPQADLGVAFAFLDPTALVDEGRGLSGGQVLHHLGLVEPIEIDQSFTEALGVSGGSTTIVRFDVFVESDGRPVAIDYGFAVADSDGETVGIGSYHDAFTDFGADIVITAPIPG